MKVYLSKDQMLYAQNEEEAVTYIGLKILYDKMLTRDKTGPKDSVIVGFSLQTFYYEISGSLELDKSAKAKLRNGIESLIDAKVVELKASDGKGNYIVDISSLSIKEKETYVMMTQEEIWNIYNSKPNAQMNLLRFGVNIYGTINSTIRCGFASNEALRDLSGIKSNKTVVEYIKALEDSHMLYVKRCDNVKRNTDGTICTISNVYGRVKDKNYVDNFFEERIIRIGHDFTNTMGSVRKARLTRNYNKFVAGSYRGDTIDLICECLTFNDLPYIKGKAEYEKDLSVFSTKDIERAKAGLKEHIKKEKKKESEPKADLTINREDNYDYEPL